MTRHAVAAAASAAIALALVVGCAKPDHAHDHPHPAAPVADSSAHTHEHIAPHGGTAIALGDELYHLELVSDAATGRLTAYVLDGEMEKFIRLAVPSFEIIATVAGEQRALRFAAVANPATGETVGDTSQFEAQADWLKTTPTFAATIPALEIRGTVFTAVAFNFPAGNEHE
jgi:hypothetical protein